MAIDFPIDNCYYAIEDKVAGSIMGPNLEDNMTNPTMTEIAEAASRAATQAYAAEQYSLSLAFVTAQRLAEEALEAERASSSASAWARMAAAWSAWEAAQAAYAAEEAEAAALVLQQA